MATIQELNEPIDVVTVFREGRMAPVKFRWAGRVYPVTRVAYRWVTREGAFPLYHFSIVARDAQLCEVVLNTQTMQWSIVKVQMEG
ncbi:MAG: hypothetical protein FJ291_13445 [Planctomycetes bacterium]|nr:hypothetical protein [Planctomycetota bacterium]